MNDYTTSDPRVGGLDRVVGATVFYVASGAFTPLIKFGTGTTNWCTVPQGGGGTPTTSDPRVSGRTATVGAVVMYVAAGAGTLLRKYGPGNTDWATVPVISGGAGGTLTDGNKGDITVSSAGSVWAINAGVIGTSRLGVDVTTAGKALLDDADAAAQRTTLGLATIASSASAADLTTGTVATARLGSGTANATTFLRGDQTWATPAGGSGSGASGTATLNFGAFPGGHETFVSVADASVTAGSVIHCSIRPAATAAHSADEHYAEAPNFALVVQSISAGVGFEIWARYQPPVPQPLAFPGRGLAKPSATSAQNTNQQPTIVPTVGGTVPRAYGQWTIQWIRI